MSCEDQAMVPTKHCFKCSLGFDEGGKPIKPALVLRGEFWCCPICHASYGADAHPDLVRIAKEKREGRMSETTTTETVEAVPADPAQLRAIAAAKTKMLNGLRRLCVDVAFDLNDAGVSDIAGINLVVSGLLDAAALNATLGAIALADRDPDKSKWMAACEKAFDAAAMISKALGPVLEQALVEAEREDG